MAFRGLTFSIAIAVVVMTAMISMEATTAQRNNNNGRGRGRFDAASTHYIVLDPRRGTGQERFFCLARGSCHYRTIECPSQCPQRKPRRNRRVKGCFADCSRRCETTCRRTNSLARFQLKFLSHLPFSLINSSMSWPRRSTSQLPGLWLRLLRPPVRGR